MSASREKRERKDQLAQGMTERQKQELKLARRKKTRNILYTIAGLLLVGLVSALLVWNSGIVQRSSTALTVGNEKFTPGDVSYYYNLALNNAWYNEQINQSYYEQVGMEYTPRFDPAVDPALQYVDDEQSETYHDVFLASARDSLRYVVSRYHTAVAEGFTMNEDDTAAMEKAFTDLKTAAEEANYTLPAYLRALYGRYMTEKIYRRNLEMQSLASAYNTAKTGEFGDYSDEELTAYYEENPQYLDTYNYQYCYINGTAPNPVDENGEPIVDDTGATVTATDEENAAALAAAKANAEAMVADLRNPPAETETPDAETPDAETEAPDTEPETADEDPVASLFAAIAPNYVAEAEKFTYTQAGATNRRTLGADLKNSYFGEWLMDDARQTGDVELFAADTYGYYVIEYGSRELDNTETSNFRHILFQLDNAEDGSGPSAAALLTAEQKADAALRAFNAGEKTAARFGEMANRLSEDGGSNTKGGLYEKVTEGQMVPEINDWIFDPARKDGDVAIINHIDPGGEDDGLNHYSGVHVVYFAGRTPPAWKTAAESERTTSETEAWSEGLEANYEVVDGSGMKYVGR